MPKSGGRSTTSAKSKGNWRLKMNGGRQRATHPQLKGQVSPLWLQANSEVREQSRRLLGQLSISDRVSVSEGDSCRAHPNSKHPTAQQGDPPPRYLTRVEGLYYRLSEEWDLPNNKTEAHKFNVGDYVMVRIRPERYPPVPWKNCMYIVRDHSKFWRKLIQMHM